MSENKSKFKSGLVFIVIFFLLLGGKIKAFNLDQESQEEFFQTYSLSFQGYFELENVNGLVLIRTWAQPKAEIKAIKKTRRNPENLKLVRIEVKSEGNRVTVRTIYPRFRNTGVTVDYEILLPKKLADTSLEVVNGRIQISGNLHRVRASAVNGNIQAEGIEGPINFSAVNGKIEAVITSGPTKIETVNGPISCQIRALNDNLTLETVNGPIKIKMPAESSLNAYLEAKSTNGEINIDLPLTFKGLTKIKGSLEGQIGTGGPLIRLRTINGSITLSPLEL